MNNNTFRNNENKSDEELINFPNRAEKTLEDLYENDPEEEYYDNEEIEPNAEEYGYDEASDPNGMSESKQSKFGEEEYKKKASDKDYYKNKQEEDKEKIKEAEEDKRKKTEEASKIKKEDPNGDSEVDKTRQDRKVDRQKVRDSKRNLRSTKRDAFNTKLDSAKSNMYQTTHPFEAAKEKLKQKTVGALKEKTAQAFKKAAQAAGKAAVKMGTKLASLITNPVFWIVVGIAAFLLIIIIVFAVLYDKYDNRTKGTGVVASKCEYSINGINADTNVELISCSATKDNYEVLETVNLEKYIAGVALAEMGEDYNDEAMKAQIIAVRSYTLTRNIKEYGVGYDASNNVIRLRACENDQVYWDYDKDIYRGTGPSGNVALYSPEYKPAEGEKPWKTALSEDVKLKYEAIVSSVLGKYVVNESGSLVQTGYINTTTEQFKKLAIDNAGTENGSYTAILMAVYPEVKTVMSSPCDYTYYGEVGEFSTWKQKTKLGASWGKVSLGCGATIDSVGCLLTSISMQIANSGVPTGNITDFNPGSFAEAMKAGGYISCGGAINSYEGVTKIIPDFKYMGRIYLSGDNEKRNATIKEYANQNYYLVIEVSKAYGGQHWVALDAANSYNANWNQIYIWDPATTNRTYIDKKFKYKAGEFIYFKAIGGGNI